MVAVAALTVASSISGTLTSVSADSVSDAQSAITQNKSKSAKIVAGIEKANAKVIDLDRQVSAKNAAISKANADINSNKEQITKLGTQISAQKKEITARKAIMAKQLVSLQKQSGDSVTGNVYADFLLNSSSLSDLLSRSVTVNKLNQAEQNALGAVKEAKGKLDDLQAKQEAKARDLSASKQKLVTDKADLLNLKADAQKQESALAKTLSDNKALLASLQDQFDKATAAKATAAAKKAAAAAKASADAASATPVAATSAASGSYSSSGNSYPWGQCTWYAKQRSGWAGNGWGNGGQWGASAAAQGFQVDHKPAAGAIVSFAPGQDVGGWKADAAYGHVAYVESVSGDSITISQGGMGFSNPAGPNTQTISGASAFTYIHPKN